MTGPGTGGRLAGKVALISGTAGGQGRGAAIRFAAEGARVVGRDVKAAEAEETVAMVRAAGGEMGPVKSCGLLVVHEHGWPLIDLRVDWNDDDPIVELRRIWGIYEPQMNDYITRALNPSSAPSYNVPGDP